ncbi:MFS transporter [Sciscionella sediminilitoris]|uniref:MFS transporter n=1 Tax=Sciscionella sediminilitoris TaxID=1445613 RepID=UPI000B0BAE40|nr:MFS transporter [Sciscionella sp. SE31]
MDRNEKRVVTLACLIAFVVILDATIVAVALPRIRVELGFGATGIAWVVNAYTLVFAGFQLFGGRCVDVFGVRRMLGWGLGLFALGSVAAGLAPSAWLLLAARAVQGLGGALLIPASVAAITRALPDGPRRASALAMWSMIGALGSASGTVLGGVLTEVAGWRLVFLINVPFVLLAALLTPAAAGRAPGGRRPGLDLPAAVLVTAGLSLVVDAIIAADWLPGVLGVLALVAFLGYEWRLAREPMLPLGLLRVRTVAGANLTMFAIGLGFFATPVLLSLYLQGVLGYPPLQAGLAFVPSAVATVLGGRIAGKATSRFGARPTAVTGLAVAVLGFATLALFATASTSYALGIALPVVLLGFGIGLCFTPLTVVATRGVGADRGGIAAGLLNTTRQCSGAAGIAILTAASTGPGFPSAFALTACAALAAVLLAATLLPREQRISARPVPS